MTAAQVFSCKFYQISKNTYFVEHQGTTASRFVFFWTLNRQEVLLKNISNFAVETLAVKSFLNKVAGLQLADQVCWRTSVSSYFSIVESAVRLKLLLSKYPRNQIWGASLSKGTSAQLVTVLKLLEPNINVFLWELATNFFQNTLEAQNRKLRIWSHLLKKSLIEKFIFCAVDCFWFGTFLTFYLYLYIYLTLYKQHRKLDKETYTAPNVFEFLPSAQCKVQKQP